MAGNSFCQKHGIVLYVPHPPNIYHITFSWRKARVKIIELLITFLIFPLQISYT